MNQCMNTPIYDIINLIMLPSGKKKNNKRITFLTYALLRHLWKSYKTAVLVASHPQKNTQTEVT